MGTFLQYLPLSRDTGEQITLSHKYIYLPEDVDNEEEVKAKALEEAFA